MQHPADCVGDVGSAAGPLMVGLAALGMRGGYHRSPALVYSSSDRGGRTRLRSLAPNERSYSMGQTTFANMRGMAHKGSGGMSLVFPDVCKTPTPPAPPSRSPTRTSERPSDTSGGPTTVTTDGQMPMVKGAVLDAIGDEAGSVGGILSQRSKDVRIHDVLLRREVRRQERLPDGRPALAQQEEHLHVSR